MSEHPLGDYMVLDFSDDKAFLCGRILADFGADVIKVEKPGGDTSRRRGPFYHDMPHPEKSLYWWIYNANKRGITLNIESAGGQEILRRLLCRAHFLIESFPPGYMDTLGMGFEVLHDLNPNLIVISITHFGKSGPSAEFEGCDIVHMATGGMTYVTGDVDRAPLRIGVDQAYLQAGAQAAAAAMIAHYYWLQTGEGQHIDVSVQEAAACAAHRPSYAWDIGRIILRRQGEFVYRGKVTPRVLWACKDGYVSWRLWLGQFGRVTKSIVEWMNSEGVGYELRDIDFEALDFNEMKEEELNRFESIFAEFFLMHNKREICDHSLERNLLLFPVNDVKDIKESEQLKARGFWGEVDHPELGVRLTYPEAVVRTSAFNCGIRRRAPLIGEHNREIYEQELGLSRERLLIMAEAGII